MKRAIHFIVATWALSGATPPYRHEPFFTMSALSVIPYGHRALTFGSPHDLFKIARQAEE